MKHIARKRFGQHFLTDGGIIDAIVNAIAPVAGQPMVEIGPGLAALTQPLVERLGHLTVIELDRDLAVRLRRHAGLTVIEADVLDVDFAELAATAGQRLRVVGNLPYNISTPILFHLLPAAGHIIDQHHCAASDSKLGQGDLDVAVAVTGFVANAILKSMTGCCLQEPLARLLVGSNQQRPLNPGRDQVREQGCAT